MLRSMIVVGEENHETSLQFLDSMLRYGNKFTYQNNTLESKMSMNGKMRKVGNIKNDEN